MVAPAIVSRVQDALEQLGNDCSMDIDEVAGLCPDLTWNQVLLAIDSLSRTGEVCVTRGTDGIYRVRASHAVGRVTGLAGEGR